jgi:chromate transporter
MPQQFGGRLHVCNVTTQCHNVTMNDTSDDIATHSPHPPTVSFWQAFAFWLKLGFISFGGPAGQIAIMHEELVEKRRWLSEARFLHALNYCMVLPGPEAQQLATYIGWLMHRSWGGIVAGVLFVLPSLLLLIVLSWIYLAYGATALVAGLFYGIKPAVVAIVAHAAHRVGGKVLKNRCLRGVAVAAFVAIFVFHVPFPYIVIVAALLGHWVSKLAPTALTSVAEKGKSGSIVLGEQQNATRNPAIFDDHSPTPAHAQFAWGHCAAVLTIGVLLWALPLMALNASYGWEHTYTQMAWFFTKAALLTFGGAYAVLPYVYQGAVGHYHWLSPTQMVDGLALGESTPGPLIIVVAFVGFVGGYGLQASDMAAGSAFLSGAFAAFIVTWFTFLPSFVFILAGGPFVESTRNKLGFAGPLTAISAAVTGVIVNLALFFAYHVLWPQGFGASLASSWAGVDWLAVGIAGAAAVALFRFKRSVLQVIAGAAVLGLLAKMI